MKALELLEEALTIATDIGAETMLPETRLLLSRAYLSLGRTVEGWESATAILDSDAEQAMVVKAKILRAEALKATGGMVRAKKELAEALSLAESKGLDDEAGVIRDLLDGE